MLSERGGREGERERDRERERESGAGTLKKSAGHEKRFTAQSQRVSCEDQKQEIYTEQ